MHIDGNVHDGVVQRGTLMRRFIHLFVCFSVKNLRRASIFVYVFGEELVVESNFNQ